jgi:hypothetical protein
MPRSLLTEGGLRGGVRAGWPASGLGRMDTRRRRQADGSERRLEITTLRRTLLGGEATEVGMDTLSELRELRTDYASRIDCYPKDNPRGATARAVYQIVINELDARLARLTSSAS